MNAHLTITTPGTQADCAVHCRDRFTGKTGTFLFVYDEEMHWLPVSPICRDLSELFKWMDAHGWAFNAVHSNYIKV